MVREAIPVDVTAVPELARLANEVERTRTPRRLERDGKAVAMLVPVGGRRRRPRPITLVDTSNLPPIPYRTLEDLIADREPPSERAFSWQEIKEAVERDRVEAWRRKSS